MHGMWNRVNVSVSSSCATDKHENGTAAREAACLDGDGLVEIVFGQTLGTLQDSARSAPTTDQQGNVADLDRDEGLLFLQLAHQHHLGSCTHAQE